MCNSLCISRWRCNYKGWNIEGYIADKISGSNGFGYDPIFYVPEYKCTTADMTMELKNKISHRAKALKAIKEVLVKKIPQN